MVMISFNLDCTPNVNIWSSDEEVLLIQHRILYQEKTPTCSCMFATCASLFGHSSIFLLAHARVLYKKDSYILACDNIMRVYANIVYSVTRSHSYHVRAIRACTRNILCASYMRFYHNFEWLWIFAYMFLCLFLLLFIPFLNSSW
jgi:ABC-type enterochelin transport system permease subunit